MGVHLQSISAQLDSVVDVLYRSGAIITMDEAIGKAMYSVSQAKSCKDLSMRVHCDRTGQGLMIDLTGDEMMVTVDDDSLVEVFVGAP